MGGCLFGTLALALAVPAAQPLGAAGALEQGAEAETVERRFSITLTWADYERLFEQPFDVPPGVRRVEVAYRVSGADAPTVVDLVLRSPSRLRGWSGGSRSCNWVSALGATPGHLPGAVEPGDWAGVLGVPNIRPGRTDSLELTVRLFTSDLPEGPAIADRGTGWFVGDLHARSGHSDGRVQSRRGAATGTPPHWVFDAAAAAGLDFVALTDHNTTSHWLDVDRLQPYYDDLLLLRGRELTTYRGHANTVGERTAHDLRLPALNASPGGRPGAPRRRCVWRRGSDAAADRGRRGGRRRRRRLVAADARATSGVGPLVLAGGARRPRTEAARQCHRRGRDAVAVRRTSGTAQPLQ